MVPSKMVSARSSASPGALAHRCSRWTMRLAGRGLELQVVGGLLAGNGHGRGLGLV